MGDEDVQAKYRLYEQFARVGKALGNPLRLILLDLLAQAERSAGDLAAAAAAPLGNTSAQLQILRAAGLVDTRRDGNRIYYRLADDEVTALLDTVTGLAHRRLGEAERAARDYLGDLAALEPIRYDELRERIDRDEVIVLDVRPSAEYEAGHIPGAQNIPISELAGRLGELPADTEIAAGG
jgi:DNA-binding transcriptional ArsR family regulator